MVSGEQSLLVIGATWGPKPFATEDVDQVLDNVETITIVAIDRAGNRSRPAIRRFVVGSS